MKNDMLKNVIFKFPENFQRLLTSIIVPMTIYFISTLDRRDSSGRYFWIALGIFVVGWIVAEYINWRNAQREREKDDGETLSDILKVFRFRPYNEIDHDTYFRPDALHEKALDWLVSSEENVLYLTGASGAGKTSLLRAWLAPEFRKLNPESEFWIFDNLDNLERQALKREVSDVQSSAVKRLGDFIRRQISDAGDSSEKPDSIRDMLEQEVKRIQGKLIVAIDQFGSSLMLRDHDEQQDIAALFDDLTASPIDGLVLLFVMRSDRTDLGNLTLFNLPPTTSPGNRFEVRGLFDNESITLLERLAPDLSDNQRQRILNEAKEIDAGAVRPVTLNIAGKALERVGESSPRGTLIERYLRQLLTKPGYDETVPKILDAMITRQRRTRPITIGRVADQLETTPERLRSLLRSLEKDGLVRSLDKPRDETWEIAHSFLAEQLGGLIPRLGPNRLANIRQHMMLVTAGTAVAALIFWGTTLMRASKIDDIDIITVRADGSYAVRINGDADLARLDEVRDFDPITSLTISNTKKMERIPALDDFDDLTELTIKRNDVLRDLRSLMDLSGLQELTISDHLQMETLPNLNHFEKLDSLDISNNARLTAIPSLNDLDELTTLEVRDNQALTAMPHLDGLGGLEELWIVNNKNLQDIPNLGDIRRLKEIALGGSVDLSDAEDPWFDRTLELLKDASPDAIIRVSRDWRRQKWDQELNDRREHDGQSTVRVQPW